MGTKAQKEQKNKVRWSVGFKQRSGQYSAMGMNATSMNNKIKHPERKNKDSREGKVCGGCEMCGGADGEWRANVVWLCSSCYEYIQSIIGLK
jgi:hypothetical protein